MSSPESSSAESSPGSARISVVDRLFSTGFIVGLAAIVFFGGMIAAIGEIPPYPTVRNAWIAMGALSAQQDLLSAKYPDYLWMPTDRTERGLVHCDTSRAEAGYTLYTSAHDCVAMLLDMEGKEVYRWTAPFRQTWPHAKHLPSWVPDNFLHLRCGHVYPNGDLLTVYSTTASTPYGSGMAKVDRNGKPIWTYDANAHHDFAFAKDGSIYTLTHRLRRLGDDDERLADTSDVPVIEDFMVVLSPDGEELKSFSLLESLLDSPYFRRPFFHADRFGDITHCNAISLVGPGFASHHEGVSDGDVLVCLRNLGLVVVLNPESEKIVWATNGPWSHPHDPDPLENGNLLIFDNYIVQGQEHGSAVLEFDPKTRDIVWQYAGTAESPFRSDLRSRQQLLPGGNVLITEADGGRLLEVARDGQVVWEFINPIRGGDQKELVPVVCDGRRYSPQELPFLNDENSKANPPTIASVSTR